MKLCEDAIKIQDVTFRYQKKVIIDHVSFTVPRGKISLLMGASGSGKSTLSHIAAGLLPEEEEELDSGKVTIFDKDLKGLKNNIRASYVTMMFQNPDLQFCMDTLRKEMRFCLENISVPKLEMDERIESTAKDLSLESLLDRKLFSLSGGEKQRATLCCLCVMNSKCLILDEPFANLDDDSAMSLITLLQQLRDNSGVTILAVDHQIDHWMGVFDNLILLGKNGKVLADGVDEKALHYYINLFDSEGVFYPDFGEKQKVKILQDSIKLGDGDNNSELIKVSNLVIRSEEETRKEKRNRLKLIKLREHENKIKSQTPLDKEIEISAKNPYRHDINISSEDKILINQKTDISFKKGCMTALLGKSGCGKTTLFLSLLKQHSYSGSIKYDGEEVKKIELKNLTHHIGIVFQNPINQFVSQNVLDEVKISLKLWNKGIGDVELNSKALELLEYYGLSEFSKQSPYLLSQGQMRRLAVLSVLSGGQSVLLLDEPTYGQDRKSTETIMKNLKYKMDNDGLTVIFTTHDRKLASNWADIIYEVNNKSFVCIKTER